eukprot:gnl/MRDRNA2_/MRDRNA2_15024_c0_seq1.p1 gnl/MRDRNA2_/MRDRNA2_15024_c0~~gnl/MRDRNA2_/MRDRNA2_15024_c0_seq1.p1  ORF type:complete len:503 (+),score=84.18 gnl/MRDRNA2_/MRDRNA2_15024_c0_seq1:93-1511(+)
MAQFIRAFRAAPLGRKRASRARAVLREIYAADLLSQVSELGAQVFGFKDLPPDLRENWRHWTPEPVVVEEDECPRRAGSSSTTTGSACLVPAAHGHLYLEEALQHLRVVRGDEVSAYSEPSVLAFLRQTKASLEAAEHYTRKAKRLPRKSGESHDFFFISYVWEPPSRSDPRRAMRYGERPHRPPEAQGAGHKIRGKLVDESNGNGTGCKDHSDPDWQAREWYAQAQAKSIYLEFRGQRETHPKEVSFWIERASLPQSGDLFELARKHSFFLLEYILLSKALIAVVSSHYFSRGWCLFEFATKLAFAPTDDPGALGVAWKAFASFGTRKDGFPPSFYATVIQDIAIEKAEFSLEQDRAVLLRHIDWLFTSRPAFDRFARFAALLRLGRSCYTREDRIPFVTVAQQQGFHELAAALDVDAEFDLKRGSSAVCAFDVAMVPVFAAERQRGVRLDVVTKVLEAVKVVQNSIETEQ